MLKSSTITYDRISRVGNTLVHKSKGTSTLAWSLFRALLLIGLGFILVYPVIYMFSMSIRATSDINDPSVVWIPKNLVLSNFSTVIKITRYWEALRNTVLIGIGSAVIQTIACAFIGYGFARFQFKERNLLFSLVIFTIIVPPLTLAIPLYLNFIEFDIFGVLRVVGMLTGKNLTLNIINTPFVLIIPSLMGLGIRGGLYILVYRQFFRGLPKELEEAALIDGCGPFATFWKIMIPSCRSAMLTVFLFSVVWHWNDYFSTSMFMGDIRMMATTLASLQSTLQFAAIDYLDPFKIVTYMQAGCLLAILPILVLYLFTQRLFTESIERTGIVG